mgnify:CR=1 FL=1
MKRVCTLISALLICLVTSAKKADNATIERDSTAIYQGMNVKLDLATSILELARYKGDVQSYEIAANVNLKNRFFPTLELGYGSCNQSLDNANFNGKGGFGRVGLDMSALRKSGPHNMLLVGIRVGTAVQGVKMHNISVSDPYWQQYTARDYNLFTRTDVWGEVVAGVQVQVYKNFHMGWFARLKFLFTRDNKNKTITAYYIPGYGYKQDTNWGVNYYIGLNF